MRVKELKPAHMTPEFLAKAKRVAASALNQREKEASSRKIAREYQRVGFAIDRATMPDATRAVLQGRLETLGALLFPAK